MKNVRKTQLATTRNRTQPNYRATVSTPDSKQEANKKQPIKQASKEPAFGIDHDRVVGRDGLHRELGIVLETVIGNDGLLVFVGQMATARHATAVAAALIVFRDDHSELNR